uniref:Uncharacterized protein n=1 Tax=Opuntia streptacantha TaxID=393608 RepID=A0A7C9D6Z7_OPUST
MMLGAAIVVVAVVVVASPNFARIRVRIRLEFGLVGVNLENGVILRASGDLNGARAVGGDDLGARFRQVAMMSEMVVVMVVRGAGAVSEAVAVVSQEREIVVAGRHFDVRVSDDVKERRRRR